MIERQSVESEIRQALHRSRVVALIGPRQCGKTTLARQLVPLASPNYFDLEDPISLVRLAEPMTALSGLEGVVVIDEVQRDPALFSILRVLADRNPLPAKFLLLGSASPDLLRRSSETLAGRIETITLGGFSIAEVGAGAMTAHWLRGGFPPAFLSGNDEDSFRWRRSFQQTFVERDIPLLGFDIPSTTLQRFWTMVAHYHGGIWNGSELARSIGVSENSVRRYLDILSGLFMVRQLPPWHENLKKRQVKSPKVYVRDSGLLHALLGIKTEADLHTHPKLGASWEGYALEEALKAARADEAYFWATHQGAELDLLLIKQGKRYGVEAKRQDAPRMTPSMRIALEDLKLDHLTVLYPGDRPYPLAENVTVQPLVSLARGEAALLPSDSDR
jgi:uncharacterized protein